MYYTLGEAAKETGKSKTTIKRYIDKGRLSAKKNDNGEWEIDPAELHRVYPMSVPVTGTKSNGVAQVELEAAQRQIEELKSRVAGLETDKDDLRKDRDHWRQQATALLTDRRGGNGGFWSRLFGK